MLIQGNIGCENGVTITHAGYVFGDELGYIHEVDRNGSISTTFLGDGKIRHPLSKPAMVCLFIFRGRRARPYSLTELRLRS